VIKFLLPFLLVSLSSAQATYSVTKSTALTAAAEVITVQQPAANAKIVRFVSVYVDSTVATLLSLEVNGAAATATTLVPVSVNPSSEPAAVFKAFSASDSSGGTVIGTYSIAAGSFLTIDLSNIKFLTTGTNNNLTLRTNSITGTVHITFVVKESST